MPAEVVIYTKKYCASCVRAKSFLEMKGVPYREIPVGSDRGALEEMVKRAEGRMTAPQIFIGGEGIGGYDAMMDLEEQGRLDPMLFPAGEGSPEQEEKDPMEEKARTEGNDDGVREVVIIGSGCAGLTSAVYAARANLEPLVVEGREAGGQLTLTTDVENFPGFPEGIQGPELVQNMKQQAARFGAEFAAGDVTKIDLSNRPFRIWIENGEEPIRAKTLVLAMGASARMLGLEGERELIGHGLSTCATCDGFFFRDKEIAIVGGGDSAMEEATFLTRFASKVTVIHRRDELRASKIMQQRAFDNPKVEFLWDSIPVAYLSEGGKLSGVRVRNVKTDEESDLPVEGCFLAIGHIPNTKFLGEQVETDSAGYLLVHGKTRTSVNAVFAAGDVHDQNYRQAITASAMGCMAAIDAEKWLEAGGVADEDWLEGRQG